MMYGIAKAVNPIRSYVRVQDENNQGSSYTYILRYSTVLEIVGTDISYLDSATDGASFIINTPGVYIATMMPASQDYATIVKNVTLAEGSTFLSAMPWEKIIAPITFGYDLAGSNYPYPTFMSTTTAVFVANIGDVIKPYTAAVGSGANGQFSIMRLS